MGTQRDPVSRLEEAFVVRKKKNPLYSLRAFARDVGVSAGQMSKIMNRSRPLTYRQLSKIAPALQLTKTETDDLVRGIILQAGPTAKVKTSLRKRVLHQSATRTSPIEVRSPSVERFKAISQWYHLAILELSYVKNFSSDPAWIASQLGISKIEARAAVERLVGLGFFEVSDQGRLTKTDQSLFFETRQSEPEIRAYEKTMMQKAAEALEQTDATSFQSRLINSITFPTSPGAIPHLKKAILQFQKTVLRIIRDHDYDQIYQLNCQLFPLTHEVKK